MGVVLLTRTGESCPWTVLLLNVPAPRGFCSESGAGMGTSGVALKILPFLLLEAPELVLGVDVMLLGILGLGVHVEGVDCALPSTTLSTDGALPDQVSSVGRCQECPLALVPAVAGLALGFGGKGLPGTVCRLLLLVAPAVGSPFSQIFLALL